MGGKVGRRWKRMKLFQDRLSLRYIQNFYVELLIWKLEEKLKSLREKCRENLREYKGVDL